MKDCKNCQERTCYDGFMYRNNCGGASITENDIGEITKAIYRKTKIEIKWLKEAKTMVKQRGRHPKNCGCNEIINGKVHDGDKIPNMVNGKRLGYTTRKAIDRSEALQDRDPAIPIQIPDLEKEMQIGSGARTSNSFISPQTISDLDEPQTVEKTNFKPLGLGEVKEAAKEIIQATSEMHSDPGNQELAEKRVDSIIDTLKKLIGKK